MSGVTSDTRLLPRRSSVRRWAHSASGVTSGTSHSHRLSVRSARQEGASTRLVCERSKNSRCESVESAETSRCDLSA
eukprot:1207071-Prymnesium_polylepis.1